MTFQFLLQGGIKQGLSTFLSSYKLAESGTKIIKPIILKAGNKKAIISIIFLINNFLFQYQNTKHSTTEETPAKLLLG